MRRSRPLIALAAAYSLMLAAVFGEISAGHTAALGTSSLCLTSASTGEHAPVLPAEHDLGCCVGSISSPAVLPSSAAADIPIKFIRIVPAAPIAYPSGSFAERYALARAPPAAA